MSEIVVAAAVAEHEGAYLITRRPRGVHLEGYWEFPGGKCEPDEPLSACLAREMREELAVEVRVGAEIFSTAHEYPERRVRLHFFECDLLGTPTPQLGQQMRWVTRADLPGLAFPPADAELIAFLIGRAPRAAHRS